jgi:ATP-binding protein involved in chromosome partitioning
LVQNTKSRHKNNESGVIMVTKERVLAALQHVQDPASGQDIVTAGLVSGLFLKDDRAGFILDVPAEHAPAYRATQLKAEEILKQIPEIRQAMVVVTSERAPGSHKAPTAKATTEAGPSSSKPNGMQGVKRVIAVASGKGGVGKSTVAVNLALALDRLGLSVGLLDADIYGPSIPKMLGLSGKPESNGTQLMPHRAYGLKAMSIGLLVDPDTAMIWRGPMASSALQQMMVDVAWGNLDVLVVDMPPGTGDIALTIAQRAALAGAVVVSTPQDIALIDARKGLAMFRKVNVPILGIVENMSFFCCPECGARTDIFGHGGAEATAGALQVPFLGGVPLHLSIREGGDCGAPVVASAPGSPQAHAFFEIAAHVAEGLMAQKAKAMPVIEMVD